MRQQSFLERLQSELKNLPPSQDRVAQYILSNYDTAAFCTSADVARAVGVSESSVVRFAQHFGFRGYAELKEQLQSSLRNLLQPAARHGGDEGSSPVGAGLFTHAFDLAHKLLDDAQSRLSPELFDQVAQATLNAQVRHIVGLNGSQGTASLLGYHLGQILPHVRVHIHGGPTLLDAMNHLTSKDIVIAFSFPRYARATVETLRYARSQGAVAVAVTDSPFSLAAQSADICLATPISSITFGNSYLIPTLVADMLIAFILARGQGLERLERLEEIRNSFDLSSTAYL